MDHPRDPVATEAEAARSDAFRTRWRSGIAVGGAIGLAVGIATGAVLAVIVGGSTAGWMAFVGCVIGGIAVGVFVGGLSRLESPAPGVEPTEVERPVLDEPNLTKTEHEPRTETG
jgi:hypothetical protein